MENKQNIEIPSAMSDEVYTTLRKAVDSGAISEAEAGERYLAWLTYYRLGKLGLEGAQNGSNDDVGGL